MHALITRRSGLVTSASGGTISGCAARRFTVTAFRPRSSGMPCGLYLRFTLSFRDVEDVLTERGIDVSYETVGAGS
jgi:hypothetical protein